MNYYFYIGSLDVYVDKNTGKYYRGSDPEFKLGLKSGKMFNISSFRELFERDVIRERAIRMGFIQAITDSTYGVVGELCYSITYLGKQGALCRHDNDFVIKMFTPSEERGLSIEVFEDSQDRIVNIKYGNKLVFKLSFGGRLYLLRVNPLLFFKAYNMWFYGIKIAVVNYFEASIRLCFDEDLNLLDIAIKSEDEDRHKYSVQNYLEDISLRARHELLTIPI